MLRQRQLRVFFPQKSTYYKDVNSHSGTSLKLTAGVCREDNLPFTVKSCVYISSQVTETLPDGVFYILVIGYVMVT